MGLIAKDDGWRVSDELWNKMEVLLPKPKTTSVGMSPSSCPESAGDERDPVRAAHRSAVELVGRDGNMFVFFGVPAIQGVE